MRRDVPALINQATKESIKVSSQENKKNAQTRQPIMLSAITY